VNTLIRFGTGVISNAALEDVNLLNLGDGNTELTGANHHIQNRNLYAYVDTAAGGAAVGNNFQSSAMVGAEFAQKIADMGYGGRTLDIGFENGANDIVRITSHGLIGNNDLGNLTTAHGGVSFHGDAGGFGVDNAPESGGRWINTADALDFAVQSWNGEKQAIKTFSFTVDVNGTGSRNVLIDFDGNVAVETNPLQNVQLVGAMATRTQQDAFLLGAFNDGDAVTLNFDAKTITVNGVTSALSAAITDAFEAASVDNVTIGAERTDSLGFSLANVAIGTVTTLIGGGADPFDANNIASIFIGPAAPHASQRALYATVGEADPTGVWSNTNGWVISGASVVETIIAPGGTIAGRVFVGADAQDDNVLDLALTGWIGGSGATLNLATGETPNNGTQIGNSNPHASGYSSGDIRISNGLTVDSSGNPLSEAGVSLGVIDGTTGQIGAGNSADESGGAHLNSGEMFRFELQQGRLAGKVVAEFSFNANSSGGAADTSDIDVALRLYRNGELIESKQFDLSASGLTIELTDNLGQLFDTVEVQTAQSGAWVRLADIDLWLV
jgi:hypothetical protein